MRSNIARTWNSGRVPDAGVPLLIGPAALLALERSYVLDELVELLRVLVEERPIGGHRGRRVHEGPGDRLRPQPLSDLGQRGAECIAVVADLVAAQAARGRGDLLALLVLRRSGQLDLGRRAGERSLDGQV